MIGLLKIKGANLNSFLHTELILNKCHIVGTLMSNMKQKLQNIKDAEKLGKFKHIHLYKYIYLKQISQCRMRVNIISTAAAITTVRSVTSCHLSRYEDTEKCFLK